jgi:hypothetical protein
MGHRGNLGKTGKLLPIRFRDEPGFAALFPQPGQGLQRRRKGVVPEMGQKEQGLAYPLREFQGHVLGSARKEKERRKRLFRDLLFPFGQKIHAQAAEFLHHVL